MHFQVEHRDDMKGGRGKNLGLDFVVPIAKVEASQNHDDHEQKKKKKMKKNNRNSHPTRFGLDFSRLFT
jgi:hypothetical protein